MNQWWCFDWESILDDAKAKYNDPNIKLLLGGSFEEPDLGVARIIVFNTKKNEKLETIGTWTNKELSD